jgi:hypothetical protein
LIVCCLLSELRARRESEKRKECANFDSHEAIEFNPACDMKLRAMIEFFGPGSPLSCRLRAATPAINVTALSVPDRNPAIRFLTGKAIRKGLAIFALCYAIRRPLCRIKFAE